MPDISLLNGLTNQHTNQVIMLSFKKIQTL